MSAVLLLQLSKWGRRQPFQQHKIAPRTHSSCSLSICQHTPIWSTLFRSPQTRSSIHTPAHPPHQTDTCLSHAAHLSLIGLSVFSSLGCLAVCQCWVSQYLHVNPHQWSHNKLTHTHTHTLAGSQVTGEQSHTSVQWSWYWRESCHQHYLSEIKTEVSLNLYSAIWNVIFFWAKRKLKGCVSVIHQMCGGWIMQPNNLFFHVNVQWWKRHSQLQNENK